MVYQNARKLEIRDAHARRVEEFAREYKKNRPTIVLLPGGMGSQINRSGKSDFLHQFIEDVSAGRIKRDDLRATDEKIWRRIVQEINLC